MNSESNEISELHLRLIEAVANDTYKQEWPIDGMLNIFIHGVIDMTDPRRKISLHSKLYDIFENTNMINLIIITDAYYNLDLICKELVKIRQIIDLNMCD